MGPVRVREFFILKESRLLKNRLRVHRIVSTLLSCDRVAQGDMKC